MFIDIGEDNYGIFQKTSKDNYRNNWVYIHSLDCRTDDVTTFGKIGKL
jgi:hypothetical protein